MLLRNNLINTILHKLEPSWGHPQAPQSLSPLPRPPAAGEGQEAHPLLTVSSRSPERSGQTQGRGRRAKPPRPGSSPAAAAHRPRGLPAGRSRVRGMSVRRPLAAARGLAAFRGLRGSASGARGPGPGRGPWGGGPRRRFQEQGKPPRTPGNPRPRAPDSARERPGVPAAGCGGSLPGGAGRRAAGADRWLRGTPACSRVAGVSRGWESAGSPPRTPSPPATSRPRRARRGRAEGLVSGRTESFAH